MNRICIGIHVYAEPQRLQATLAALRAHTKPSYDLLMLPDGPDEITRVMLANMSDVPQLGTPEPLGAPACFNRLTAASEAEVLVLLESGAIVGPGWLDGLLAALEASPRHGLAGPSTNRAWNEQSVAPRGGGTLPEVAFTAQELGRRFGRTWRTLQPLYSLADFCYAVRREVVQALGAADEGYGLGPCWEMDYNIRAARAGFQGVWACAAYVYRAPFTPRRQREEAMRFEASKRRYQDRFCGLRLQGEKTGYETHCRGDACPHFAPASLIQIRMDDELAKPNSVPASPAPISGGSAVTSSPSSPELQPVCADEPLVTCIMPTYNRRAFIPQAIHCFLSQDYPNRELLILDDGTDPIGDCLPDDPRIRYMRLPGKHSVGAKRNLACAQARGTIIVHWDDDDWYPAWRVRVQVQALLDRRAEVCGSSQVFYYEPGTDRAWRYAYTGSKTAWAVGNTLAYWKHCWQRSPFPDVQAGEDTHFLWKGTAKVMHDLADPKLCVATIHSGNVSPKVTNGCYWSPYPSAELRRWMAVDIPPSPLRDEQGDTLLPAAKLPWVSCIMPTYNRRAFVRLALQGFAAQDYPHKELVIVDDGTDAVQDLAMGVPGVRYLRLPARSSIGAKRNLACQQAQGEIIAHWDDDDWYAPQRLSYQVMPIVRAEADMTGLENAFTLVLPTAEFWSVTRQLHARMFQGDVHGGTLVFRKAMLGSGLRYPEVNLAEDALLIRQALNQGQRLLRLANPGVFVYVRHGQNAWQFEAGRFLDPHGWEQVSAPATFPTAALAAYQATRV